ncbi:unnamed protein product [Schistosoma margrebowiei]|uniref:Peptidase M14 domain-containing protein n=1 Tax=Schistosoma margrebowiei TaxID=48269 RepID=A0A183MIH3_9TREM|nr:unnamed protein product [Schistosoma margrebowiei]
MQDYNYLHTNSFEITLELGCEKYPNASELPRYWNENKMSLLNYILQTEINPVDQNHFEMSFKLADKTRNFARSKRTKDRNAKHGRLNNKTNIVLDDQISSEKLDVHQFGYYYRLLTEGKYIVTASADGFIPAMACVDVQHTPSINAPFVEALQVNFLLLPTNFKRYDELNSITIPLVSKKFHISGYLHDNLCLKQYNEIMNMIPQTTWVDEDSLA